MSKTLVALALGILSFFLFMFIGESATWNLGNAGFVITYIVMAAYFFIAQFRLSRGNTVAYRKDWPVMLALDAAWIVAFIGMILSEKREVVISQGPGILVGCFVATWVGALAASVKARRFKAQ